MGLHEEIRQYLWKNAVLPYLRSSEKILHVDARRVHDQMGLDDRYPAICSVLDSGKFLEENGLRIVRRVGPKQSSTVEWWFERRTPSEISNVPKAVTVAPETDREWTWEGNVQSAIATHLTSRGYKISSAADTASREAGKDLEARGPDGKLLWVSVKGWPEKSVNTQARHWFFPGSFRHDSLPRGEP